MKTLSIMQPWASLLAEQVKTIELRGWSIKYRGPLLIRASGNALHWENDDGARVKLPTKCLLFVGELTDVRVMEPQEQVQAMSGWWNDQIAWHIEFLYYVKPIPAAGRLKTYGTPDTDLARLSKDEARKYHPELKIRTKHPFRAEMIGRDLLVVDRRTGEQPFCNIHMSERLAHVFIGLYGYLGGIRLAEYDQEPIQWSELVNSINKGIAYRSIDDLPCREAAVAS